ncbi:MFS transporter [Saccharopolyspora sp. 6T]|uniref:MFS transporter n=1 Tax=Saccharopolyspora sp. 6T TaxID=2877238 RepID=UPI001CD1AC68|nr:MFS transporter [Saccharopolyspora sp. 6T]MCA1186450.1 MFS transporter [Saccharopolyspora sp. 6T]
MGPRRDQRTDEEPTGRPGWGAGRRGRRGRIPQGFGGRRDDREQRDDRERDGGRERVRAAGAAQAGREHASTAGDDSAGRDSTGREPAGPAPGRGEPAGTAQAGREQAGPGARGSEHPAATAPPRTAGTHRGSGPDGEREPHPAPDDAREHRGRTGPDGGRSPGEAPENSAGGRWDATAPPRKLTVTRVAAWRGRQLTRAAMRLFFSAAHADGAAESGLARFSYAVMLNYAVDAAITVALANTLFFSAATGESRDKVALYLLITVAPFAVIAPVIGPALDRLRQGRRTALAVSFGVRVLLAAVMAMNFDGWLLYPAALGCMVLSKSFGVLKAAMTPRVLPAAIDLTTANSRLTTFGLAAGGVFGAVASGFAWLLGSPGALWFMAALAAAGVWLCLRITRRVESSAGEARAVAGKRRRAPLGPHVVVALWGNAGIRVLTGFLTLFAAFVIKESTRQDPAMQVVLLGAVGGAAGLGSFLGNAAGARMRFGAPDRLIVSCLGSALAIAVCAAVLAGVPAAVAVGLVAATASALAKVCLDAVVQRDVAEESRASAFGRSETVLQLSWVFGGALGVLLPPVWWIGFTTTAALLALVLVQTVLVGRGGGLVRLPRRGRRAEPGTEGVPAGARTRRTAPDREPVRRHRAVDLADDTGP